MESKFIVLAEHFLEQKKMQKWSLCKFIKYKDSFLKYEESVNVYVKSPSKIPFFSNSVPKLLAGSKQVSCIFQDFKL